MEDNQFQDNTATRRIFSLRNKIRAVSGGTGAGKTISIVIWLIDYAQSTKDKVITVVGESYPHLNLGAMRDFKNILLANGYWNDDCWNESSHTYKFPTGTLVEFVSFDKFGKAHGPRRDVLYLNEANNIPYNIADQLITRTRAVVWLDWNPSEEFWFYTDMLGKRTDVDFIGENGTQPPLTYLDNEALSEEERKEIEAHRYNASWWKVYGEGKMGVIEGRIYKDWRILNEIPFEARLVRYGVDFGYTNDPTAIIALYYYNGGYIVDEVTYAKGLSNKQIADIITLRDKAIVVADSAEPKSIDEIKAFGVDILPAQKGKDSVKYGIDLVQSAKMSVTARSVNVIREYRNYLWMADKNGKILNEPEHHFSHSQDAIRYAMESANRTENEPQTTQAMREHIFMNQSRQALNSTR